MEKTWRLAPEEIRANLTQFTGTENYYRHPFGLNYTDGVKYVAESCSAYWLLDAIASYQLEIYRTGKRRLREFQVWKLSVNMDHSAVLSCREDSNKPEAIRQELEFTDFPLAEIEFFVQNGVLFLPSEY